MMNHSNQQLNYWPWKLNWKSKIPHKVACFVWLLAEEAVLTQENLMKRGIILSPMCFLCGEQAETVNHLILHCRITGQLWRLFLNLRGIAWSMPGKITEALKSWEGSRSASKRQKQTRIVPTCIWGTICRERNSKCFENVENSMEKIKLNCLLILCFV
ncbi:hypothetical protein MTR67_039403 [Solanum verrucosum]|uniref:Reverse transcriptase zinc-binding domain-containing protein n=1 Tax=Solanum verrucosum TaxID=315347 RepID=A0AAF0UID2_SOLVR|nr:hypothetical protein MTR67_039403 [Solanum verrucosum]